MTRGVWLLCGPRPPPLSRLPAKTPFGGLPALFSPPPQGDPEADILASGIYDLVTGRNSHMPAPGIHLFIGSHTLSSLLFLGYLIAHVVRRRKRLWRSQIR